jgi:hypothetical protein
MLLAKNVIFLRQTKSCTCLGQTSHAAHPFFPCGASWISFVIFLSFHVSLNGFW